MELARLQDVYKDYGHRAVLSGVSFRIGSDDRIGLIGRNGAGKTSVLRVLTGEEPPTSGAVTRGLGLRIGYVPQHLSFADDRTVLDNLLAGNRRARAHLRVQEQTLAGAAPDELAAAVDRYEEAREAYERAGGEQVRARAVAMLDALGLAGRGEQLAGSLSGGEKNVMSLTQALLAEPDLLVLDEPGNHLDFAGIAWLEAFLAKFRGAVLLVSHNRYLLDRVVTSILQLEDGAVGAHAGNYSAYRAAQLREKLNQRADYVVNQRRLAQLEALVKRFEDIARRTGDAAWGKRLRARKSQLAHEREQAVEKPRPEASAIRMAFTSEGSRADVALQVRGYSRSFGDLRLFDGASAQIACGERVALVGPNGCGKTTLLRDIVARGAWDDATLRVGPSLRVGYCAQEQEVLEDDRTVMGELRAIPNVTPERATSVLLQFLFRPDDFSKRVGDLSGGERNRLQLARLIIEQPGFLILDEPTNHLDIPACEAIEDALADFKGTILAVSHDRYFLDKLADRVIEVREGGLQSHPGNFSEYWASRPTRAQAAPARVATRRRQRERPERRTEPPAAPAADERMQRQIEEAEREAAALERRVAEAFTRGDHREGTRAAKLLDQQRARIEELYRQWLSGARPPAR